MEGNSVPSASIGGNGDGEVDDHIITVEELERRKDRFRRATKEYYEQAERGVRRLYGFDNRGVTDGDSDGDSDGASNERIRKRIAAMGFEVSAAVAVPRNSLKRCRGRRYQTTVHKLEHEHEAELARCLLESHFEIVELAIGEYLSSIRTLIRPVRQWQQQEQRDDRNDLAGRRLASGISAEDEELSLPSPSQSPIPFDENQLGECLQSRLHRHHSEVAEEQHMAMASVMAAVREMKLTEGLAKKIHNGIDSIQNALRRICASIEANRNSTFYYCHYECDGLGSDVAATTRGCESNPDASGIGNQEMENDEGTANWNKTVVEALKLDGYYRWFRANNGVLLIGNKNRGRIGRRNGHEEEETDDDEDHQIKRLRKEIIHNTRITTFSG